MNLDVIRWRPLRQGDLDESRARVERALERWRLDWFTYTELSLGETVALPPRAQLERRAGLAVDSSALSIVLCEGDDALMDRALDFVGKRPRIDAKSTALLHEFERDLAQALGHLILQNFQAPKLALSTLDTRLLESSQGGLSWDIETADGGVVGQIFLEWRLIQTLDNPTPRLKREPVADSAPILEIGTVPLHVRVGHAEVRFEEFLELAPGDVIVLDRTLDEPVECRATHGDVLIAASQLYRSGDALVTQLL